MEIEGIPPAAFDELAVFPLPEMVQFPGTVVPLHVFEPRYLAMVRDCLAGHRVMGVVMLKDGADPLEPAGQIHPVACVGRIIHDERTDEGRYNILVHGVERARLTHELAPKDGYRRFRARVIPPPDASAVERAASELGRLQSCVMSLRQSVEKRDEQLVEVLRSTADPLELADILSAVLVRDANVRQQLLELTDLRARLRLLIDNVAEVLVQVAEPVAVGKMN